MLFSTYQLHRSARRYSYFISRVVLVFFSVLLTLNLGARLNRSAVFSRFRKTQKNENPFPVSNVEFFAEAAIEVDKSCGLFRFNTYALIGFILLGAGLVFLVLFLILCCCCCGKRSSGVDSAPKKSEEDGELTIICTQVYGDAWLWENAGKEMRKAMVTYRQLIRKLITKYKCYEVSCTDGCFTIACDDPLVAIDFVSDIPVEFMRHQWKTTSFDDVYKIVEREREALDPANVAPTANLPDATYASQWNGLRINVGVSTGSVYTRRTWGNDFFFMGAPTVLANTLSEIGSNGQILVCDRTFAAVSHALLDESKTVEDRKVLTRLVRLSTVELYNDLSHVIAVYQVNTIDGRNYGGVRVIPHPPPRGRTSSEAQFLKRAIRDKDRKELERQRKLKEKEKKAKKKQKEREKKQRKKERDRKRKERAKAKRKKAKEKERERRRKERKAAGEDGDDDDDSSTTSSSSSSSSSSSKSSKSKSSKSSNGAKEKEEKRKSKSSRLSSSSSSTTSSSLTESSSSGDEVYAIGSPHPSHKPRPTSSASAARSSFTPQRLSNSVSGTLGGRAPVSTTRRNPNKRAQVKDLSLPLLGDGKSQRGSESCPDWENDDDVMSHPEDGIFKLGGPRPPNLYSADRERNRKLGILLANSADYEGNDKDY